MLRLTASPAPAARCSGCTTSAPSQADVDCPEPQEGLVSKEACLLFGRQCLSGAAIACHQRGMVCSRLVLFSPLFCARAWQCLRAFRVVAIPQSGLLAQVSSAQIALGAFRPGPYSKQCSPCLPAQPPLASGGCRRLCCFSAGGVTDGHLSGF